SQGAILEQKDVNLTREQIEAALGQFRGTITQTPPSYSAVQVGGKRAYEMAREGEEGGLKPRTMTITVLEVTSWKTPDLTIDSHRSSGTYIRAIANDLGQALGVGGHIVGLTRTATGPFTLDDAHDLDELQNLRPLGFLQLMRPTDDALLQWPEIR